MSVPLPRETDIAYSALFCSATLNPPPQQYVWVALSANQPALGGPTPKASVITGPVIAMVAQVAKARLRIRRSIRPALLCCARRSAGSAIQTVGAPRR